MSEPLDVWVENNAKDLREDVEIQLEVFCPETYTEDRESCVRTIMTCVRQWYEMKQKEKK